MGLSLVFGGYVARIRDPSLEFGAYLALIETIFVFGSNLAGIWLLLRHYSCLVRSWRVFGSYWACRSYLAGIWLVF